MSFWEDLQAWTQAQYDALMADNAKRRKKWTAEDINRLLRDRIAERLKAKQGKAIGAEFRRTGGRLVPITPLDLFVENGLLWGNVTTTAQTLHSYRALKTALNSYGTTTDANGSYASILWDGNDSSPSIVPYLHTGLGRLFFQSLIGAQRLASAIMPSGWSYDLNISLVRSPIGEYWITRISNSTGLSLVRLDIPEAVQLYETMARTTTLTPYQESIVQAQVLGQLVRPATYTTYTVLTGAQVSAAFTAPTGYYSTATLQDYPGWGWQWTWQRKGAADELAAKAIIVAIGATQTSSDANTKRTYARKSTITLNWAGDGTPTTATVDVTNYPGVCWDYDLVPLYRYTGTTPSKLTVTNIAHSALVNYQGVIVAGQVGDLDTFASAFPVAAWFDKAGAEQTVEWGGQTRKTTDQACLSISPSSDLTITFSSPSNSAERTCLSTGGAGSVFVGDREIDFAANESTTYCYTDESFVIGESIDEYVGDYLYATHTYSESWTYHRGNIRTYSPQKKRTLLFGYQQTVWVITERSGYEGEISEELGPVVDTEPALLQTVLHTNEGDVIDFSIYVELQWNVAITDPLPALPSEPNELQVIPCSDPDKAVARNGVGVTYTSGVITATAAHYYVPQSYNVEYLARLGASDATDWVIPPDIPASEISMTPSTRKWIGGA